MSEYENDKKNLLLRLRRIEGQVRGLQKMVDEDQYCIDILTQISSVMAATKKVGLIILDDHIHGCVKDAVKQEGGEDSIDELITALERFMK